MFIVPKKKLELYKNDKVINFITDFFDTKDGIRCRVRHHVRNLPFYYTDCEKCLNFNLVKINNENIRSELQQGLSHFLIHIYDEKVLTEANDEIYALMKKLNIKLEDEEGRRYCVRTILPTHYLGITNVIDIDSPAINENTTERMNFFDKNVIDYFNKATELIANLFDYYEEKYVCEFSGNGFYFINEPYIPNEYNSETINEYKKNMVKLINEIDEQLSELNIPIQINQKNEGWNRYNKMPFTYHKKRNRISIPLNKNNVGNIDADWLNYVSNVDNVINDNSIIDEIITKSGW